MKQRILIIKNSKTNLIYFYKSINRYNTITSQLNNNINNNNNNLIYSAQLLNNIYNLIDYSKSNSNKCIKILFIYIKISILSLDNYICHI